MTIQSERYDALTKNISQYTAGSITNLLSDYNVPVNSQFQERLEKILFAMLTEFRKGVINERILDETEVHLKNSH